MERCQAYGFFAVHMVLGFLMLWLCYYYVQITLVHELASNLFLKTLLETSFLLLTVVWGSVGWDSYKDLRNEVQGKNLASELAASTASLSIGLPIFVAAFDFFINVNRVGVVWGARSIPVVLLALAIVVGIVLLVYRHRYQSSSK